MQTNPNINAERIKGHLELDAGTTVSSPLHLRPGVGKLTPLPGDIDFVSDRLTIETSAGTKSIAYTNDIASAKVGTLGITIDGAGSVISTGFKQYLVVPYACTITGWSIIGDVLGSCVMDVCASSTIPTSPANSIAGTELPTLTTQQKSSDYNLTTWSTSLIAGDVIGFYVNSVTTLTKITLILTTIKS